MKKIFDDFNQQFKRTDNGLIQLILINIVVFVVMGIIFVFSSIFHNETLYNLILQNLYLPGNFNHFLNKPWTLFTYFFTHSGIFHILFNMLALYWFGKLIHEYLGNRRLINIYILGGLFGGIVYLIFSNTIPFFMERTSILGLVGASGSVIAIAVAAATLVPNYTFFLVFIGPVKIKYIVAIYIFIYFLGTVGDNSGGNICHLGGALLGFVYIKQLQKGTDLGKPFNAIARWIQRLRSPLKVSYRKKEKIDVSQKDIDAILDKINRSGYSSLTKEEKERLFKASQK